MTITRETLGLAARAAGLNVVQVLFYPCPQHENCTGDFRCLEIDTKDGLSDWNPLTDHGQLLDLAMACKIVINPRENYISFQPFSYTVDTRVYVDCQDFPALAEAVIRAAAEQQKAKEK